MTIRKALPGENDPGPASTHYLPCRGETGCGCALRELDEAIARARGWFTTDRGTWTRPASESEAVTNEWHECIERGHENEPPPFSSSWALAGSLLGEMRGGLSPHVDGGWIAGQQLEWGERGSTPCEAIARAWLAHHEARTR